MEMLAVHLYTNYLFYVEMVLIFGCYAVFWTPSVHGFAILCRDGLALTIK